MTDPLSGLITKSASVSPLRFESAVCRPKLGMLARATGKQERARTQKMVVEFILVWVLDEMVCC